MAYIHGVESDNLGDCYCFSLIELSYNWSQLSVYGLICIWSFNYASFSSQLLRFLSVVRPRVYLDVCLSNIAVTNFSFGTTRVIFNETCD